MPRLITRGELTDDENRVLRAACLMALMALFSSASTTLMLLPMLADLGATGTGRSLVRAVPYIGSLLAIFPAGVLGRMVGPRRFLLGTGVLMATGSALVLVAPAMAVAIVGQLLVSVGRSAMFIVVVALLAEATGREGARPVAFSAFGTMSPASYLAVPVLAGVALTVVSWRVMAGAWVLAGIGVVLARRLLPPDGDRRLVEGELWTPVLAGLALTALVQFVSVVGRGDAASVLALVWAVLLVVSSSALVVLLRRLPSPSLSLDALRGGGLTLLLLVVVLVPFSNLWYYTTVGLQYLYGKSSLGAALWLVPPQAAAVAGASTVKRFIKAKGITVAGTTLLLITSASLFLTLLQTTTVSLLPPLAVLCVYGASTAAVGVVLSTAIMNRASAGSEGSTAAFRGAAAAVGGVLGVLFMSTVAFVGVDRVYDGHSGAGADRTGLQNVMAGILDGDSTEDIAAQYDYPTGEVVVLEGIDRKAMVGGYRAQGLGGGVVTLGSAVVFYVSRRRHGED